jgi:ATP-dependent RNA helicase SrmB
MEMNEALSFEEMDLDERLLQALKSQHFHTPTPVQAQAIPPLLDGKDLLAGAPTGTGKTAAFVLPALQHLIDNPARPSSARILILAPTRELAFQTHKVIKQLGEHLDFNSVVVTGGFNQGKQLGRLEDAFDILVATPGRLLNIMTEEHLDLSQVEFLVIDEADRMLDMGQGPDVKALIEAIPGDFQAALFSATLAGAGVQRFAEEILEEPEVVEIAAPNEQSQNVQQFNLIADDNAHKQALLKALIEDETCERALVFCNKKERAIALTEWLQSQNLSAQVLHGDFVQAKRMEKMQKFKQGKIQVMVATDVAARGLDIQNITHVINFDIPFRGDIYIHRIGRTGRGHQVGIAYNLVAPYDLKNMQRIEYHLQQRLPLTKVKGLEPRTKIAKPQKAKKKPHKKKLAKQKAKLGKAKVKKAKKKS